MNEESTNKANAVDSVKDVVETVAAEADAATVAAQPAPASAPQRAAAVVVSGDSADAVFLSRCVYKSKVTRKSLSVHHLQRRLGELGFADATSDKDGWYGDLTLLAVKAFQTANKLDATGIVDADTLTAIFKGDPHVALDLDN